MDRFEELVVVEAILDEGNLARAARKLRRSAPAVSRILAGLEARLGVRLFERTTRSLVATDAGRALGERARRLLADYGDAIEAAGEGAGTPRGRLRVTAPVVFGGRHVAPVVTAYRKRFPAVTVELMLFDTNIDLVEQEIDVAVRIGPLADSSLIARRVGAVSRVLVASPDYLARRGEPRSVDDLAGHDIVAMAAPPSPPEWRFTVDGRDRSVRVTAGLVVNQIDAGLAMVRAGQGIGRPLSYQVAEDLASGALRRLLPGTEPAPLPIHLLTASRRLMPARVRAFLDLAAPALANLKAIRPLACIFIIC